MPLIKRTIDGAAQEVLAEAGVTRKSPSGAKKSISAILDQNGLSREDVIEQLRELARFAEKEETRLHASKLALELHGELKKNDAGTIPQFTFIIQGYDGSQQNMQLNTILTPREI